MRGASRVGAIEHDGVMLAFTLAARMLQGAPRSPCLARRGQHRDARQTTGARAGAAMNDEPGRLAFL